MANLYESGEFGKETVSKGLEDALGWMSNFAVVCCMLALQYPLLKIHRLRRVLAPEAIPTISEVWVGIAAFWICQLVLGVLGNSALRVVLRVVWDPMFAVERLSSCGDINPSKVPTAVRVLVDRMVVSWILHHGLVILLDIIIPFAKDQRRNLQTELTSILSRTSQFLTFIHKITLGSPATNTPHVPLKILIQDSNSRSTIQTVRLQRTQTDHSNEGQRTLAWNLVVDKEALDEMKETLGPPGGFGELGFSIGRDGLRFEAMGVGTSFVLDFEVVTTDQRRAVAVRRKTK
ncbi:hypothetical protein BKA65DRAFT_68199 [Rhexocercosporidium sp. MPI-PUGE-AT-0058]|nr:hypothetical protein BKA65DRAFT_68199 [Rhexocercosporidium sp. MPI-PUGE-AT-0058]